MSAPPPATVNVLPLALADPVAPTAPMSFVLQPLGNDCAKAGPDTRTNDKGTQIWKSRAWNCMMASARRKNAARVGELKRYARAFRYLATFCASRRESRFASNR